MINILLNFQIYMNVHIIQPKIFILYSFNNFNMRELNVLREYKIWDSN
jgi:hypothetical protein